MVYYSEILKKKFDTAEECLAAEDEYSKKVAEEEKKKKEIAEARKLRAKEVEDSLIELQEARKKYTKLLEEFCKDYGSFHMSLKDKDRLFNFLDWF